MNRRTFLKQGALGLGAAVILPACAKETVLSDINACVVSPVETEGPFPLKTPEKFVRSNIIGDRVGVSLEVVIKIENVSQECQPLAGMFVDIWHCDAQGNYSEYKRQLAGDFSDQHFLRGRQVTDETGSVSFQSIYPGWYPGRAPHIHIAVLNNKGESVLITQMAFPEAASKAVYATPAYNGDFDTPNDEDGEFEDSLNWNLANTLTGNTKDGYSVTEVIKVAG